jgi:hypothetical protein
MKNLILLLLTILLSGFCHGQQKISTERLKELFAQSEEVNFSKKIQDELKDFSVRQDVDVRILNKNMIYIKTMYNQNISAAERILLCDMILNQFDRNMPGKSISFPLDMVKNLKQELLQNK